MFWLRILFLLTALHVTSAYRWRCYFACTDQTSTQEDYVEQRDKCREYAQLKVDMAQRESGADDRSHKSQLVSLFSQCMGNNGWIVPDGKGDPNKKPVAAAPAMEPAKVAPVAAVAPQAFATASPPNKAEAKATPTAEPAKVAPVAAVAAVAPQAVAPASQPNKAAEKATLSRTSECAFARHSAAVSSIAAKRAQACDMQCVHATKAAPGGPRPASCPPDVSPRLSKGSEQ